MRNEITSQARAALAVDRAVDTIFEIGGQDSKYIRIDHGAVVDFAMNNACAAGTGSFLEEQAERLGISIRDDFSRLALASPCPVGLGERCTVFMESDLVHHQQQVRVRPAATASRRPGARARRSGGGFPTCSPSGARFCWEAGSHPGRD